METKNSQTVGYYIIAMIVESHTRQGQDYGNINNVVLGKVVL